MSGPVGVLQGKVWGTTQCIFSSSNVEVHRIDARKGGYCSQHCHRGKYNLFYVERGRLKVTVFRGDAGDDTVLTPGMSTSVAPGERHMFEALDDTVALEIYYVQLDPDDIERYTQGGTRQC